MRTIPPPLSSSRSGLPGFTLLEIMIALALVGMVLVGLNYFVFSMGELWGRDNEKRLFEQHVRAVSRYVGSELRVASMPPQGGGKSEQGGATASPFQPTEMTPSGSLTEVLLAFELPAGTRLLNWPERRLPEVVCAFQVKERQGLFLLWHSRLEEHFEDDPPREVLVSRFCTGIAYDYYDEESRRWTTEKALKKDPQSGEYQSPKRLRLYFALKGWTQERIISLNTAGEGLPNF